MIFGYEFPYTYLSISAAPFHYSVLNIIVYCLVSDDYTITITSILIKTIVRRRLGIQDSRVVFGGTVEVHNERPLSSSRRNHHIIHLRGHEGPVLTGTTDGSHIIFWISAIIFSAFFSFYCLILATGIWQRATSVFFSYYRFVNNTASNTNSLIAATNFHTQIPRNT